MYQTQDEFISLIEQLYISGMDKEAEEVSLIMLKYIAQMDEINE